MFDLLFTTQSRPRERILLKTLWEKEKMLVTSNYSFSYNVFLPIKDKNDHLSFIYSVVCKCFQFGQVQNFGVYTHLESCITLSLFTKQCFVLSLVKGFLCHEK